MRPRLRSTILLVALALIAAPGGLLAQVLGEIKGTVKADNDQAIPGVTVVVKNNETGAQRTTVTDEAGLFSVKSLPSGPYTITGSLEGMQPRSEEVTLLVGQALTIDLAMGVEATAEEITVVDDTPLIETGRSTTASYITSQEVESIPIVGRDFKNFAILSPAVHDDPSRGFIAMAGQRGVYSGLRVDGTSAKNAFFGYANGGEATENDGLTIAQESVKEFQVVQNGFNPEYGLDGGGFVNVVTKSGTNQFHGSGFYYYTDEGLAEDIPATPLLLFRNPSTPDSEPSEFERENWGLTAGGPIVRDKMHWFVSWDETDRVNPFVENLTTRGAFDAVLQRGIAEPEFLDLLTGYTPNNDGIAAPDQVNGRTASGLFNRNVENRIILGKVDFYPSQSHQASLRYNLTEYERTSTWLDEESLKKEDTDTIVGSWVWVNGAKGLNDLRASYATDDLTRGNLRVGSDLIAEINFQGTGADSLGKQDFLPIIADTEAIEVNDTYSYLFGEHDLKFGVAYNSDNMAQLFAGAKDGEYNFSTLQNFINNVAASVRIYFGNVDFPSYDETQEVYALFAQDGWRVNERFTVNYGLRWGKTDNPSDLAHLFPEGTFIADDDHFEPRVGFAWQTREGASDVVRGGAGVFYGRTPSLLFASQVQENGLYPNYGRVTVTPGQSGFVPLGTPINNENPPLTTAPSTSFLDPDFEDAEFTRFNLGYERELSTNWSAAVDVLYMEGENLQRNYNDNVVVERLDAFGRPVYRTALADPALNTVFVRRSTGESEYQAATIKILRRFANRYSLQAHYTWAEDKDDDSNERSATTVTVSNPNDPGYDWGYSDRDIENRFVLIGTSELPLGFKIAGTARYESGRPWTAYAASGTTAARAINNCPTNSAICPAPRAVIGGSLVGRNSERNESFEQIDLRAAWGFDFGRGELEIFAEAFNVTNEYAFSVDQVFAFDPDPGLVRSNQVPTLANGQPNPEFGIPGDRGVQDPRFYQFGVRIRL
jgi:outer membrane receptor protein involved in Fe transport